MKTHKTKKHGSHAKKPLLGGNGGGYQAIRDKRNNNKHKYEWCKEIPSFISPNLN